MAYISQVDIQGVSVTAVSSNVINAAFKWDVDAGGQDYTGDYWIIFFAEPKSTEIISTFQIACGGRKVREYSLLSYRIDTTRNFFVEIWANGGRRVTSNRVPITFRTFENVALRYENDTLAITWNPPHVSICSGRLRLAFPAGDFYDYPIGSLPFYTIPMPESCISQASCTVSIVPYANEISTGVESTKVTLYMTPLTIASASLGSISSNARTLTLSLSGSATHVQLGFYEKGNLTLLTGAMNFAANFQYSMQGQIAYDAEEYEVAAYISNSNATMYNRRKTAANTISLSSPKLSADISVSGKVTLNWKHDAPGCTSYLAGSTTVYGDSYVLTNQNIDNAITLTPKYGTKTGVAASVKPFREGFYTSSNLIAYRGATFATKGVSFILPNAGVTEDKIESGVFKYEKASGKVTVSADSPVRADFLTWLKLLFEKGLTTAAYYKIRDVLSRLLATTEADRLWYMAGIDPNVPKRADILPGMTIRVESAQYMPQISPAAANLAGYVPSSVADYDVLLTEGFLTVSPYLNKTMGTFSYSVETSLDPLFHSAGGGLDFYNIDLKQPFWALKYPDKFPRSENASSMYPTANTALFALPTFAGTQALDSETQRYMIFRARSTISLLHTVFVNNAPRLVPVGSTVAELLSALGSIDKQPKLYRSTGIGSMAEVFWFGAATTYLMQGDRLEV